MSANDSPKKTDLPQIENNILKYWRDKKIFDQVVEAKKDAQPFVFYDGPPFTTGSPHYGHIMQMANKDAVLRYKTMQGFNVPRTIGWDTHGLPVEYQLEKELGLTGGKRAIIEFGIENFVAAARKIVLRTVDEWKTTMERMGRWVDTSHPYATMDNDYIESVWWAFKQLYDKGLVYKDFRVSPYCPRCGTVLSNFELNQGYKDNVEDNSIYTALKITSPEHFKEASLIFWTTTPWSTFGVAAMSVNPEADYILFEHENKRFVMAKERVSDLFSDVNIVEEFKGTALVGTIYEPLYDVDKTSNIHRVVAGDHVTTEDGTGIASIAPAYGDIDAEVGKKENLPLIQIIEPDGTVKKGLNLPGEGLFVKEAEQAIIDDLQQRNLLVLAKKIRHTYPFCWRCDTPLLYFPATSWYVEVTKIKERLIEENKKIHWLPEHLRDGRFGKWLEGARDWAVSRDRFWGAPLPIWECSKGHVLVIGARDDDSKLTELNDLHRPYIDAIKLSCPECDEEMQRVPFVFDCWFESGSMPYCQWHYPFANKDKFNPQEHIGYPADFIAEALDQTRGWFYTLHVLGVALFDERAYKNLVVTGLILAPDGKKLSKSLRNYVDPNLLFEQEGVDALRLFLFTSASLGEDYRFSDAAVRDVKRRWIVPLMNVLEYYRLSLQGVSEDSPTEEHAHLDAWIMARYREATQIVTQAMEGDGDRSPFNLVRAMRTFGPLVEDLSTWYVRLSRGRKDKAFTTNLKTILENISRLYAPFLPFVTEFIYREIDKESSSVHLADFPKETLSEEDKKILETMAAIRSVVSLGRELRAKNGVALKQPLSRLEVKGIAIPQDGLDLIKQELQVETIEATSDITPEFAMSELGKVTVGLDLNVTEELKQKGLANLLRRSIQDLRKQANLQPQDKATVVVDGLEDALLLLVQKQLATTSVVNQNSDAHSIGQTTIELDGKSIDLKLYSA